MNQGLYQALLKAKQNRDNKYRAFNLYLLLIYFFSLLILLVLINLSTHLLCKRQLAECIKTVANI